MPPRVLTRLRKLALKLPEAHEVEAWGTPTFRVKNKLFAMFADKSDHHGGGRNGVWVKATAMNQQLMLKHAPKRFFNPPYVGKSGWIGVYLDDGTDWEELPGLLEDAWRMTASKTLLKKHPPRDD
jgi:hypothetical protein